MVPDDAIHKGTNFPSFGTRGSLTFDLSISTYTDKCFLSSFIYFTLHAYPHTGTLQRILPPHPSAANARNGRLECPLPLLSTEVTSWRIQIHINHRTYTDRYGTHFWGPWLVWPYMSPNKSAMAGTTSTRRHFHAGRRAPRDYPLVNNTSMTAGDTGSCRPSRRHWLAALT